MTNETISKITQMETKKLVVTGIAVIFVLGLVSYAVALYAPQVSTAVVKVFSKGNETQESNTSFKENVTEQRNKTLIICAKKPGMGGTIDEEECARIKRVEVMTEEDYRGMAENILSKVNYSNEGLGFMINSANIASIKLKQNGTDPSRVRGQLLYNRSTLGRMTGIINGTIPNWLEDHNISCTPYLNYWDGCYADVPISMLDEIENSGYFVGFGTVPIEDKVDKGLLKEARENPDEIFPVEIWLFQDEERPRLVPYMQKHVDHVVEINLSRDDTIDDWVSQMRAYGELQVPKLRWSKGTSGYTGYMNGSEILKVAEYEFIERIYTHAWYEGGADEGS